MEWQEKDKKIRYHDFFFLRNVSVALRLFSFCQIFSFDLKRASPFFQRPNIDQFIDNNENYER